MIPRHFLIDYVFLVYIVIILSNVMSNDINAFSESGGG